MCNVKICNLKVLEIYLQLFPSIVSILLLDLLYLKVAKLLLHDVRLYHLVGCRDIKFLNITKLPPLPYHTMNMIECELLYITKY